MKKPVDYKQYDTRWASHNYSAKGENKTIKSSGCGIVSTAMVIASLKDSKVTPITTAEWSMKHGYKAYNQGTYYTYFVPQLKAYGITAKMLNSSNLYGKSRSAAHDEALKQLKKGNWIIACMGKGNWTSSGHYILVYGYKEGYVYINDSASTKPGRLKNKWSLFAKQVKYMWSVEVPDSFKKTSTTKTVTPKVTYKGYAGKWLGSIVNYNNTNSKGYSGIKGVPLTCFKASTNVGTIKYRVHFINGTWSAWTKDNRIAGNKNNIDAIQMSMPSKNYNVKYRVSTTKSKDYNNWITEYKNNSSMGYAGVLGKPIDKIQIQIVEV